MTSPDCNFDGDGRVVRCRIATIIPLRWNRRQREGPMSERLTVLLSKVQGRDRAAILKCA